MEEEILKEIEKNEIIEIDKNDEITNTQYDIVGLKEEVEKSKKKKKKASKWSKLPKKQKIIILSVIGVILLIIILLLVYFLVIKKDDDKKGNNFEPIVIVEKDNYRYESGKLVFIDESKKELGTYECKNKSENLCFVAFYSDEDEFDIAKKVYENGDAIENRSDILNERFVFIYDADNAKNGKLSLYDIKDEKILDEYDLVKEVNEESVIVKKDNKYGLITLNNSLEKTIDISYDYLGFIENTKNIVASSNGNYKIIDFAGKDVSKNVPGEIKNYSEKLISVYTSGNYYLYGFDGKKVLDKDFDYIRFVDDYAIVADSKKLSIYDCDGNKMNGDDIKISSSKYNTKLIFNSDLRQTGKEEAFNAYLSNKILKLEFDSENVSINLNDGMFSKNLSNVSYFAGKLYFYSDDKKETLIGSYSCNYANSINEGTSTLDNCFIAKEKNILKPDEDLKNGYLPIYNGRYVFIADTKTPGSNDNIILYDLKNNKKLATYKEVDARFHDDTNMVNLIDTAGTLVFAKNTSDSYGLINVLKDNVKGVIGFKNDTTDATNVEVKYLSDYILIKASDKTYHLYDLNKMNTNDFEITKNVKTTSEIIEYKNSYIKVKNESGNYLIYGLDGKIISDEAKYLVMEDKFYLVVDKDNTLGVYKYTDKTNLVENITIDTNNYEENLNYSIKGNTLTLKYVIDGETLSIDINLE